MVIVKCHVEEADVRKTFGVAISNAQVNICACKSELLRSGILLIQLFLLTISSTVLGTKQEQNKHLLNKILMNL